MTLDDYALYLARRLTSPNTVKLRRNYIAKLEAFADRAATRATENDLYEFLEAHPHWSTATKRTVVCAFRDYYRWAVKSGLVDVDPSEDMVTPRVHRLPSRIASEECIRKGLENGTTEDRAMLLLAAECGLRLAEIASLHRTCRHDEYLRIVGKGNRQRHLHMTPELIELLDEIEATTMRHGNYFPGQSGRKPLHGSTVWRRLSALTNTNPHSLRHRAGTVVYRGTGNDLRLTQEFLGHTSPAITAIYVHVEREDLQRASEAARVGTSPQGHVRGTSVP
ncbi:tyrosine-type recombinase/integrase [Plantibacter flavus]|uniref:tyrosine-type recombinase/integrase n=1 Tax=Plantibacter flavus TaxID=150123 RepID=UPI0033977D9C